jgi:hypothetical protein
VISELARQGLLSRAARQAERPALVDGWYLLPEREGAIVTKEAVDRLLAAADLARDGHDQEP